jgi:hypothetical protein
MAGFASLYPPCDYCSVHSGTATSAMCQALWAQNSLTAMTEIPFDRRDQGFLQSE